MFRIPTHLTGILLAILSMFLFSATYAFYKASSALLTTAQIIWVQNIFSLAMVTPFVIVKGAKFLISAQKGRLFLRIIFGLAGLYCMTAAFRTTGLAEVVVLNNMAPLFVPLLLWCLDRTKISGRFWICLALGFAGVFLVAKPAFHELNQGVMLGALSGIFSAGLIIATKSISHKPLLRILAYQYVVVSLILLPLAQPNWQTPSNTVWVYLFLAGASNILAQITFIVASRKITVHEMAPFYYMSVVFSVLFGLLFWKELPHPAAILGIGLICAGGIWSMLLPRSPVG